MGADVGTDGVTLRWEEGTGSRLYRIGKPDEHGLMGHVLVGAVWPVEELHPLVQMERQYRYYAVFWDVEGAYPNTSRYFNDKEEALSWVFCLARMR